jgi:hypothetical protein
MAVFAGHGIPRSWGLLTRAVTCCASPRRFAPSPPAEARGIAEVSLLLTDGAGPLFTEHPAGTLRESSFRAAFHLEAG